MIMASYSILVIVNLVASINHYILVSQDVYMVYVPTKFENAMVESC